MKFDRHNKLPPLEAHPKIHLFKHLQNHPFKTFFLNCDAEIVKIIYLTNAGF